MPGTENPDTDVVGDVGVAKVTTAGLLAAVSHLDGVDRENLGRKAHGNLREWSPEDSGRRSLRKMI